ncbi:Cgl0159 family (beta/alpha)8-fold protein [Streptosporangium becharense]|uniref:Cgl0159 family (beta/alpha)8-fold protein n=1 Tax=Streptosporangium becharense TaxID=1816182 RepID=UPI004063E376
MPSVPPAVRPPRLPPPRCAPLPACLLRRHAGEGTHRPAGGSGTSRVRGLVIGRALLYASDDDVATAVDTAAAVLKVT